MSQAGKRMIKAISRGNFLRKKLATKPLLLYDGYGCVCTAFTDDMVHENDAVLSKCHEIYLRNGDKDYAEI